MRKRVNEIVSYTTSSDGLVSGMITFSSEVLPCAVSVMADVESVARLSADAICVDSVDASLSMSNSCGFAKYIAVAAIANTANDATMPQMNPGRKPLRRVDVSSSESASNCRLFSEDSLSDTIA